MAGKQLTAVDTKHAQDQLERAKPLIGKICREPFIARASFEKPTDRPDAKLIHWIRHGQAFHNLFAELYKEHGIPGDAYSRPEAFDPPLTTLGRKQAAALCDRARDLNPQLVVVSPLARATKTALIAFDHLIGKVPFIAHELCREVAGTSPCDSRQSVTDAKKDFPVVDYSLMKSDVDDYGLPDWREDCETMSKRAYEFVQWLWERKETEIAVGTHSSYLFALFNVTLVTDDEGGTGAAAFFATGEMRSVWLWLEDAREAESPRKKPRLTEDV